MIVQRANKSLEITQMMLGVFVFTIFITYSCQAAFNIHAGIIWPAIFVQALGVIWILRNTIKNKVVIRPYLAWQAKKMKTLHHDWKIRIIGFIVFTLLGAIHFYVVHYAGRELMPLVYDYGIGGIAAIALQFFLSRNWHAGLSDKGIIFGSKFDSKLIDWGQVTNYELNNDIIKIEFNKKSSIRAISLQPKKQQKEILQLIEQSINESNC